MSIVAFIYIITFILVQESALNYASGEVDTHYENETYHRSSSKSDFHAVPTNRSKRSLSQLMPVLLTIRISCGSNHVNELNWRKTTQYLANEYLRISMSIVDSATNQNVMSNVDEFVMYRDLAMNSAVVYFKKDNAFYGVVGVDCYIRGLPYNFDDTDHYRADIVGDPYVQRSPLIPVHTPLSDFSTQTYPPDLVDDRPDQSNRGPIDGEPGPSDKHERIEQNIAEDRELDLTESVDDVGQTRKRRERNYGKDYYLETLIFVTKDLVDHFRITFGDEYIAWIVRHTIIYFNAVDMMIAKLPRHYESHVHINIAKIVIQDGTYPADSLNDNTLQFTDTVTKYRQFLYGNQNQYTPDSYDYVFVYTSRQILDGSTAVDGATQYGEDMYLARMYNQFHHAVPITIVQFESSYLDYPAAVHEIAKIFAVQIDSCEKGNTAIGQCSSPMQKGGAKCRRCLRWSDDSRAQFIEFIATSRNRCFFENQPRSLLPSGPRSFLAPGIQCKCFGYDFHAKHDAACRARFVPHDSCGTPLRCGKVSGGKSSFVFTVPPFDGTTCGNGKVCWEGQCVKIVSSS